MPRLCNLFIKENERFDDLRRHGVNQIFPQQLNALCVRAVMLFRPMTMRDRNINDVLDGARLTHCVQPQKAAAKPVDIHVVVANGEE